MPEIPLVLLPSHLCISVCYMRLGINEKEISLLGSHLYLSSVNKECSCSHNRHCFFSIHRSSASKMQIISQYPQINMSLDIMFMGK